MASIKTTIYLFSLLLLLALVVLSCSKKDVTVNAAPHFLFGTSYGNCPGNCDRYYAIRDGQVYKVNGQYYPGPLVVTNATIPAEKAQIAHKLLQDLPSYLVDHPEETYGCPDCHDQGGIHIEYISDVSSDPPYLQKWHIDTDTAAIPAPIRAYASQVLAAINELEKY